MKIIYGTLIIITLSLLSCDKSDFKQEFSRDPKVNFESMWTNVYNKYSFFELKNIDWLAVKNKYAAQIDTVKTEVGLFDVLASTLNELQDGHVNIFAPFDFSRSWSWYLNYPQNFNKYILERNYLGTNYRVTGALTNQIINGVGYIRYSSFENGVSGSDLDFVLKRFADLPGIIIDVRDNGGGIHEDILPKIFDPYFTTKHQSTGVGLGLYMAKMIVEKKMHGSLEAQNVEDGVEFKIEI